MECTTAPACSHVFTVVAGYGGICAPPPESSLVYFSDKVLAETTIGDRNFKPR